MHHIVIVRLPKNYPIRKLRQFSKIRSMATRKFKAWTDQK